MRAPLPIRRLARRRDRRGVEYAQVTVRVTGEQAIATLERLAAQSGLPAAHVATDLVMEELWYLDIPGMRDHVRRTRAERRAVYDPGGDRR